MVEMAAILVIAALLLQFVETAASFPKKIKLIRSKPHFVTTSGAMLRTQIVAVAPEDG
jgi:hypothetical protein